MLLPSEAFSIPFSFASFSVSAIKTGIASQLTSSILNKLSSSIEELSAVHLKGLNLTRMTNIEVLRIVREEKDLIISTTDEDNRTALANLRKENAMLDKYLADIPRYFISETSKKFI